MRLIEKKREEERSGNYNHFERREQKTGSRKMIKSEWLEENWIRKKKEEQESKEERERESDEIWIRTSRRWLKWW